MTPHELRVCPIDFGVNGKVKGHNALIIENR